MNHMQVLFEECKDLIKLLKFGKIPKYEAATTILEACVLMEGKDRILESLQSAFEETEDDVERKFIEDAMETQCQERKELQKLLVSISEIIDNS